MKTASLLTAFVLLLMAWTIYDARELARLRAQAAEQKAAAFNCRAPLVAGEFTVITVTMRNGALVGDCDYLTTMRKKGG